MDDRQAAALVQEVCGFTQIVADELHATRVLLQELTARVDLLMMVSCSVDSSFVAPARLYSLPDTDTDAVPVLIVAAVQEVTLVRIGAAPTNSTQIVVRDTREFLTGTGAQSLIDMIAAGDRRVFFLRRGQSLWARNRAGGVTGALGVTLITLSAIRAVALKEAS